MAPLLCKLTQVFAIVLVLNRSPSGSTYQLFRVHLLVCLFSIFFLFHLLLSSLFVLYFDTELLYLPLIIDALRGCFLSYYPSILLHCILLHDSLLCVRSFGCHPCASQFPSSLPIYLFSSFLPDDSSFYLPHLSPL